jgi:uncharacterized membrane protein YfcA
VDPAQALGVVAVGVAAGALSGMLGVGGAVLTTPGVRALGATPIEAIGSTIPAILPSAVSGTIRYSRARLVNWTIGITCGLTGSVFALVGAVVADRVNASALMVVTAVLLGWSGWSVYRSGRSADRGAESPGTPEPFDTPELETVHDPAAHGAGAIPTAGPTPQTSRAEVATRTPVGVPTLAVIGAGSGFVAGLLGVGGGVIMLPVFTRVLRIPVKEAVASSLVAVAIFSIPALITHAVLGNINWAYAVLLTIGVVPGAQIGARITVGASDKTVRTLAGLFFVVLALVYGISELLAL